MKKNYLLPLALILLIFSACEKEAVETPLSTTPAQSPEAYLQSLAEEVLFQYDFQDATTGERQGWFIDRTGAIRPYHVDENTARELPTGSTCLDEDLTALLAAADTPVRTLPAEEVVAFYRKTNAASQGQLSPAQDDPSQPGLWSLRAFDAQIAHESSDGCGDENAHVSGAQTGQKFYELTLLKLSGTTNRANSHPQAEAIVEWLEGLQLEL